MSSFPRLSQLIIAGLLIADTFFLAYAGGLNFRAIHLNPGVAAGLNAKKTITVTKDSDKNGSGTASNSSSASSDKTATSSSSGASDQNSTPSSTQNSSTSSTTTATDTSTIAGAGSATTAATTGTDTGNSKFKDLEKTEDRLVDSLKKAAAAGVLDTTDDKLFHPNDPVTRADFTRWMVRIKQIPESAPETPSYADMESDNPYFNDVEAATAAMMVQGYPRKGSKEKDFKPEQFITRQEFAVMYGTFSGKRGRAEKLTAKDEKEFLRYDPQTSSTSPYGYKDEGEIDDWARRWVAVAQQTGVLEQAFDCNPTASYSEKYRLFHPQQRMTRAEAVNILVKLYGLSAKKNVKEEKSKAKSKDTTGDASSETKDAATTETIQTKSVKTTTTTQKEVKP